MRPPSGVTTSWAGLVARTCPSTAPALIRPAEPRCRIPIGEQQSQRDRRSWSWGISIALRVAAARRPHSRPSATPDTPGACPEDDCRQTPALPLCRERRHLDRRLGECRRGRPARVRTEGHPTTAVHECERLRAGPAALQAAHSGHSVELLPTPAAGVKRDPSVSPTTLVACARGATGQRFRNANLNAGAEETGSLALGARRPALARRAPRSTPALRLALRKSWPGTGAVARPAAGQRIREV